MILFDSLQGDFYASPLLSNINTLLRILIALFYYYKYGLLYSIILFYFTVKIYSSLICYLYDYSNLIGFDLYFINRISKARYTTGGLFLVDNFDKENLKQALINRYFLKFPKTLSTIKMVLGDYYWNTPSIERLSIKEKLELVDSHISQTSMYHKDINKFINDEINKPLDPFKQCSMIQIIELLDYKHFNDSNFKNKGFLFIKGDHIMTDGLGAISVVGHVDEEFNIKKFPRLMWNNSNKKQVFLFKLIVNIKAVTLGLFESLYWYIALKKKYYKGFQNTKKNYQTDISISRPIELSRIYNSSKAHKVTINEICVAAVLSTLKKYSKDSEEISIAIPVSNRGIPSNSDDLIFGNTTYPISSKIKLISDFNTEKNSFIKELRSMYKKLYLMQFSKWITAACYSFLNVYHMKYFQTKGREILISNIPGQNSTVKLGHNKLVEYKAMNSISIHNICVLFTSFNNIFSYCVIKEKSEEFNSEKLSEQIFEELMKITNNGN